MNANLNGNSENEDLNDEKNNKRKVTFNNDVKACPPPGKLFININFFILF